MVRFGWLVIVAMATGMAAAADWPQWLGPRRDAGSPEIIKPWKGKLKVLWRQPVGEGNSSPVVAGGKVFIHTKDAKKWQEWVTAHDAGSGKELWKTAYPRSEMKFLYGNGPRATPTVAGNRIYTFGITGLLTCLDINDGGRIWQVDTAKDFQSPRLLFGASCSPLIENNAVLVNVGGKGSAVVAFDRANGKVLWKTQDDGASYASPILFRHRQTLQGVFLTQQGLIAVDPGKGKLLWRFPYKDRLLESSTTPVHADDMLIASSITLGMLALRLEEKEGKITLVQVWRNPDLTCYFSTPVIAGDNLYAVVGVNPLTINPFAKQKARASLRCVEFRTGKEKWSKPGVGTYHAALLRTGDGKLLMLEEEGDLVLIDPNPREYRELARTKICGQTWAHPALANGRLYVRDARELICVQLD